MKCIVIGSNGFIGSVVVRKLLERGDSVKMLDLPSCDMLCYESLVREFSGYDEVYNFAGLLGTSELNHRCIDAIKVNVIGAVNVFNAAIECGVPRVFHPTKPNVWLNTYTITKVASEQFAEMYNKSGRIKISSLRLFNVYGPGQHLWPVRKMVPIFIAQALGNCPIEIYGTGKQTVDLIHVDDVAEIAIGVTRCGITDVMDCGRGIPVTVNEFAEFVNERVFKSGIVHLPMREGENLDTKLVADTKKLYSHFPTYQFRDYESTMEETFEFYRERISWCLHAAIYHGFIGRSVCEYDEGALQCQDGDQ